MFHLLSDRSFYKSILWVELDLKSSSNKIEEDFVVGMMRE